MKILKRFRSLLEQAQLENAVAEANRNKANIDYIAMMTDVEIPTEEEENAQSEI